MTEKILVIDCQLAGIAGDMLVGALLDLGVDIEEFKKAMNTASRYLGGGDLKIEVESVDRRGFQAKKLHVKVDGQDEHVHTQEHSHEHDHGHEHSHEHDHEHSHSNEHEHSHGHEHSHDHEHSNNHEHSHGDAPSHSHVKGEDVRNAIDSMTRDLNLSKEARSLALNAIDSLIDAEAKMHGSTRDQVHLHEAGSVDTVVDIVGTALAMDRLDLFTDTSIYSTPVAVGGGTVDISHGKVTSPAPATLEILRSKNFPTRGGPIEFELTTPTGAALLVNMVNHAQRFYPEFKPTKVGYGAGTKNFEVMSNVVRLTLGETLEGFFLSDQVMVLETNLDDTTGEIIGHTIDKVMQIGAKDISVIPTTTKKNRPGYIVKVIAAREDVGRITMALMMETGTLGVRMYPSHRHILPRQVSTTTVTIEGREEPIRVKVSKTLDGRVIQVKPEYDDLASIAEKTGKPIRVLMEQAKAEADKLVKG